MAILATQYPVFKPAMRIISNITNDAPALITTTFAHGYADGIIVRIIMPLGYGMQQINQLSGSIVVVSDTTFTIDINTTHFSPYSVPETVKQYPQVVPFGEDNYTVYQAYRNVLPY